MITINKNTFVVKIVDAESDYGNVVGKGKNLESAIELAEMYVAKETVEYGIYFIEK